MKNYNNSNRFFALTILLLITIFVFFVLLKNITIWDYLIVDIVPFNANQAITKVKEEDYHFLQNHSYGYQGKRKVFYKIEEVEKNKKQYRVILTLSQKIKEEVISFTIPKKKETLIDVLYKNWRIE